MFTPQREYTGEKKEFKPVAIKGGNAQTQVGLLVELGTHEKLPKYAKDNKGNIELNEDGSKKIIMPNKDLTPRGERKDLDAKVNVYLDLLKQTHDYEGDIGVRNVRIPLVEPSYGLAVGLNYTTVAPRTPNGDYIKGQPWTLAPASKWFKMADVAFYREGPNAGKSVKSVIFHADYKNPLLNDVRELLGKPFNINLEVKTSERDGNTYTNTKVKGYVPLDEDAVVKEALIAPVAVLFNDTDLLVKREDLGGACKLDLLRVADLRKIVLATNYPESNMQKAIQEKYGVDGEKELIAKAQESQAKAIAADKELQEIYATLKGGVEQAQKAAPKKQEAVKPAPQEDEEFEDDIPF